VVFPAAAFAIVAGTLREYRSSEHVTRSFCGDCGTQLVYRSDRRSDVVDVPTATLDEPDVFAPEREIWTGEKLAWETLNASLPQFLRSSKG
jgi:hypothetical protein